MDSLHSTVGPASTVHTIIESSDQILWGDPKRTQLFYRGRGTVRGRRHASHARVGSRVSPAAASWFAAALGVAAAAAASAPTGGAVRREAFEVACDGARRARLLVQLDRQLREGPPGQRDARGVNGGKGGVHEQV